MKFYLEQVDAVFSHVKSTENGLTTAEAEKRLAENGKKQRQAVGELRADMAADTIAGMWEQEPTEDDETS